MKKQRLDLLLIENGFFQSREKAQAAIMAGLVLVDEQPSIKAGTKIDINSNIRVIEHISAYVSRGGFKLEKAVKMFNLSFENKIVLDIGASTGGFTDCVLQNHAKKVFAVDVGYGQLDWKLRNNDKVVCIERTNIRYLTPERLGEQVDFIVTDVSFISLTKIMPAALALTKSEAEIVALIKPQFEAGKENIGKNGVVKNFDIHKEVINKIIDNVANLGLKILGITFSPIKGPKGNIEYLIYLKKSFDTEIVSIDYQNELMNVLEEAKKI